METATSTKGAGGVRPLTRLGCGFPECTGAAVAGSAMCEQHRRVTVSQTGSWLEAG